MDKKMKLGLGISSLIIFLLLGFFIYKTQFPNNTLITNNNVDKKIVKIENEEKKDNNKIENKEQDESIYSLGFYINKYENKIIDENREFLTLDDIKEDIIKKDKDKEGRDVVVLKGDITIYSGKDSLVRDGIALLDNKIVILIDEEDQEKMVNISNFKNIVKVSLFSPEGSNKEYVEIEYADIPSKYIKIDQLEKFGYKYDKEKNKLIRINSLPVQLKFNQKYLVFPEVSKKLYQSVIKKDLKKKNKKVNEKIILKIDMDKDYYYITMKENNTKNILVLNKSKKRGYDIESFLGKKEELEQNEIFNKNIEKNITFKINKKLLDEILDYKKGDIVYFIPYDTIYANGKDFYYKKYKKVTMK